MTKRLLALTLALLALLAALTACKGKDKPAEVVVPLESATASSLPEETVALDFNPAQTVVGLLIDRQADSNSRYAEHGFLRTAENLGYPARLFSGDDAASTAALVDDAIAAGVKGLLVWADSDAMSAAIDKATAAGIKVVVPYYRVSGKTGVGSNLYVDYDDITTEAYRIIMGEVQKRSYLAGKIVFIRDGQSDMSLLNALKGKLSSAYSQYAVTEWSMAATKEESLASASTFLKDNADIAAVLSFVPGAADIWAQAKKQVEKELKPKTTPKPTPKPTATPKPSGSPQPTAVPTPKPLDPTKRNIVIVTVGYSEENVKLVKAGTIYGFIALPYFDSTAQSMMMLDRLLRNIAAPQEAKLNAPVIRTGGVAKYESIVNEVKSWFADSQTGNNG